MKLTTADELRSADSAFGENRASRLLVVVGGSTIVVVVEVELAGEHLVEHVVDADVDAVELAQLVALELLERPVDLRQRRILSSATSPSWCMLMSYIRLLSPT